jgi:hypothetical protein
MNTAANSNACDDDPFGPYEGPRLSPEACEKCHSPNTSVDYSRVDDDKSIPVPVREGMLPICCGDCNHHFYGNWQSKE